MNDNTLLNIAVNENGQYKVTCAQGTSVNEVIFGMHVVLKCFVKNGLIKDIDTGINLLKQYCTDPQFDEVKEDEQKPEMS